MTEQRPLEGKAILVTGAGRGVGRAVSLELARAGGRLLLVDLGCDPEGLGADPAVVDAVVDEVRASGGEAHGLALDVTSVDAATRMLEEMDARFGGFDGVVAAAGVRRDRSVAKLAEEDLDAVLGVGLRAPTQLLRAASARAIERGRGASIVLCAGAAGFFGTARQGAMSAASAGLVALARSAAVELRRHAIRVNVVVPTARTRLTEDLPLFRGIAAASMMPEHVAPLFAYLLSDDAADVHGEVIGAAGGRLYALQSRETVGAFVEGRAFRADELGGLWGEITRG
ncbi:MAG: SDR family oxidoreductase [Myxococcales bacterium]|nr:SDR family oxidoreductase [Myxococcales bacterium]